MNQKIRSEHIALFLILLLAFVLRTWKISEIPFTHDELSVVFRTGYNSFSELIQDAVVPDVHPAGIQVFMNYWVAIFGDSEPAVKFPFMLFGLMSVFLVYRLGKEWFGTDAGLVSAAFVSAMEYMVMHSQTARPYASGLFFCLLMVYAWQKWVFSPPTNGPSPPKSTSLLKPFPWLLTYVLASAACAYNHYFSLMFAAVVGFSGLVFLPRRRLLPYLAACLLIILLFIPHIGIFFSQLGQKGVGGWLAKPENDFIFTYIGYAFHYSPWLFSLAGLIILAGIVTGRSALMVRNRFFYLSLIWFALPFLVAFFYSRYVDSVLQLRVMIFYFPFLLFGITGNIPVLGRYSRLIIPLLICLVVTMSLVMERRYYELYYNSRFREIILETERSLEEYGEEDCLALIDSHQRISDYYYERLDIRFEHHRLDGFADKKEFIRLLKESPHAYLSLGVDSETDLVIPGIILDHYPRLLKQIDYQGGNYYLFSRESTRDQWIYSSTNTFEENEAHWSVGVDSLLSDVGGLNGTSYFMGPAHGFSPTFKIPLHEFTGHKNNIIDVSLSVRNLDSLNNALLVVSLGGKKKAVAWTSASFSDYDPGTGEQYTVYHYIRPGRHFSKRNLELQVYVWNREKNSFLIDDFRVRTRSGNPVLYGLRENLR